MNIGPATVLIRSNLRLYVAPDGSKHQVPLRGSIYNELYPGYCPNLHQRPVAVKFRSPDRTTIMVQLDITNDQVYFSHPNGVTTLMDGTHTTNGGRPGERPQWKSVLRRGPSAHDLRSREHADPADL